ncbi:MAG TPA: TlpA disulfide reductase family protein, partial [Candidatus Kapabacteria bacterium]|nr:TlpA disulfide reductase family protein [Candidatus Kapabacteria bacterium]
SQDPAIVSMMLHMMIARANEDQNIGRMFPMVVMGAEGNDSLWQLVKQAFAEFKNPPVSFDQMQEMGKRMMRKKREAAFCKYQYRALAPAFTLPTLTNGIIDSLPKGKVTVLDFWGTWCPPCTTTLPKLDSVYQEYKTNDSVQFYAIDCLEKKSSFSELTSTVKDFIKNTGVTMPVLLDTAGAAVKTYDVYFYPTRVVIDKKGVIRAWDVGYPEENISDIVKFEIDELLDNACNQSMQ